MIVAADCAFSGDNNLASAPSDVFRNVFAGDVRGSGFCGCGLLLGCIVIVTTFVTWSCRSTARQTPRVTNVVALNLHHISTHAAARKVFHDQHDSDGIGGRSVHDQSPHLHARRNQGVDFEHVKVFER